MAQAFADALPSRDRRPVSPRLVRRVLAGAGALVVTLAAAGAAYLSQYEPLTSGNGVSGIGGAPARYTSIGSRPVYVLRHRLGETFRAEVGIHNEGPLPVTVTSLLPDVRLDPQEHPMPPVRGFYAPNAAGLQRFRPIDEGARVEAGETVQLQVEYVFGRCKHYEEGSSLVVKEIPVTYRVFGIEKTAGIDLGYDLVLENRGDDDC